MALDKKKIWSLIKTVSISVVLFAVASVVITKCDACAEFRGEKLLLTAEEVKKAEAIEYVELQFMGSTNVKCYPSWTDKASVKITKSTLVPCDFTMFYGHNFVVTGVKLKGKKGLDPGFIRLTGKDFVSEGSATVTEEAIRKVKSEDFIFETQHGNMPAIIRTAASTYKKRADYQQLVKVLCAVPGDHVHAVIDASPSMSMYHDYLLPIVLSALGDCNKKLKGVTWYGNHGQVRDSVKPEKALLKEIRRGGPSLGMQECPSWALEHAAAKHTPNALLLLTDEPSKDGTSPNTGGIPVFGIAIGPNYGCKRDVGAISRRTGGAMMHVSPKVFGY